MNKTFFLTSASLICLNLQPSLLHAESIPLKPDQRRLTVTGEDCIKTADTCLLAITPGDSNAPHKQYSIEQSCGNKVRLDASLRIKDQVRERRILANEFCRGQATLSNMQMPSAIHYCYYNHRYNLNDGRIAIQFLADTLETLESISGQLIDVALRAMNDTSDVERYNDNTEYQSLLAELQRLYSVSSYDGNSILTGGNLIVETADHKKQIKIELPNLKTYLDDSNGTDVLDLINATIALANNNKFKEYIMTMSIAVNARKADIKQAMIADEVITKIDLTRPIWTFKLQQLGHADRMLSYLDPKVRKITLHPKDCFEASPLALFTVTGGEILSQTVYDNYDYPKLKHDNGIDAQKICQGQAFYSSMRDPRIDSSGEVKDIIDLNILSTVLQRSYVKLSMILGEMIDGAVSAASGLYGDNELRELDVKYQSNMNAIDLYATRKIFKDMHILDNNNVFRVPDSKGNSYLTLQLLNSTSGGLRIQGSELTSWSAAQIALADLMKANSSLATQMVSVYDLQAKIENIILNQETWVVTDLS